MIPPGVVMVAGEGGVCGTVDTTSWPLDGSKGEVLVRLENGQQVLVPYEALIRQDEGHYALTLDLTPFIQPQGGDASPQQSLVLPVIAEALDVQKRRHETGRVRITKRVHEQEVLIDEPLLRDEVVIERIPINRIVDGPVPVRPEGDTWIVPVLEEVPVIEKRLLLKEELHISTRKMTTHQPQQVTLRREEVSVERLKTDPHEHNRPSGAY